MEGVRESPESKRKKYQETSSESDKKKNKETTFDGVLEQVLLTAAEEEEFRELAAHYQHDCDVDSDEYDLGLSTDSGTPSPEQQLSNSDGEGQGTVNQHGMTRRSYKINLSLTSHDTLLKFLVTPGQADGSSELFATNKWNDWATEVYKVFNISRRIVHPNYFLASENFPNKKVSSLLTELESTNRLVKWSYVKRNLKHFLCGFNGFEDLADVFNNKKLATPLIEKFQDHIKRASENEPEDGWYMVFRTLAGILASQHESHKESTFYEYIEALFSQLCAITRGWFSRRTTEISLVLPAQKSIPEKVLPVKPDFMVLANPSALMLVGEVKRFGRRGVKYMKHKGQRVREVQPDISHSGLVPQTNLEADQRRGQGDQLPPTVIEKGKSFPSSVTTDEPHASTDTDQHRGQGDQLPTTVNEKDKLFPSSETTDEPHASTSNEQTRSFTKSENSTIPIRSLDSKERYKVDTYLPQLFGQMLAAMEFNENRKLGNWSYEFCTYFENVQFGFAVEGFKLRFVKLVMVDLHKRQTPTVRALLSGQRFKCNMFMTQEFNLLKKHHLKMFYKMLVAMNYVSGL